LIITLKEVSPKEVMTTLAQGELKDHTTILPILSMIRLQDTKELTETIAIDSLKTVLLR